MNFYQHAGRILDKLARHEGTIKGLIIGDPKVWDKKKMYALVCETLKCKMWEIMWCCSQLLTRKIRQASFEWTHWCIQDLRGWKEGVYQLFDFYQHTNLLLQLA